MIGLLIYLIGFFVALIMSVNIISDDVGRISCGETIACFVIGLFSWVGVLALWVGQNLKNGKSRAEE
ncbi:MAG: hypothetical protein JXB49_14240 [Bacteroidales bacterium]|nr:hypothetical protein [Bacteroidales bacterium]